MKVLIDASQVAGGGAVQVALAMMTQAAADRDHEWHVAVSGELSEQVDAHFDQALASLTRLPKRRNAFERLTFPRRFMPPLERRIAPDAVYTLFGPPYWRAKAVHLVGFALGRMIYPELDQADSHQNTAWWRLQARALIDRFRRRQFHRPDYLVVESATVRDRLSRFFHIDPARIFVVANSFSPVFATTLAGIDSAPPDDRYRIAVPCSFYPHKNLGLIPPTAALLAQTLDRPFEFCFTLPPTHPGYQALQSQGVALGVSEHLATRGTLKHGDIARLYRESHAVFLPTLVECSTAVYPESFCAGVPLVTSDLDFARELCGPAASYIDPRAPQAAADALATLLTDPTAAQAQVTRATAFLKDHYPSPDQKWRTQIDTIQRACHRRNSDHPIAGSQPAPAKRNP